MHFMSALLLLLLLLYNPTHLVNKLHSRATITNSCMFEHGGSFNTKEGNYYDAFTEIIGILNFKFLKCIKLININLQSCKTNSIKSKVCQQSSFGVLKNCGAQTN